MSAAFTSQATATHEFHSMSKSGETYVKGTQTGQFVFAMNGGNLKCSVGEFTGAYSGTTAMDLTVAPKYSNCAAFGQKATVDMNGCDYLFTWPSETINSDQFFSSADIQCPVGERMVVTVGDPIVVCTVSTEGHGIGGADLANQTAASPKDVSAIWTAELVNYTSTGGICGKNATNSKFTGEMTFKAYSNGLFTEQVDLWIA